MKSTLYLKFIFIYIIFGFLSLFTAATLTENLVRTPIFNRVSNSMYREATMVATSYLPGYFSGELQESDTQMILSGIETQLDAAVWFVSRDGNMIASAHSSEYPSARIRSRILILPNPEVTVHRPVIITDISTMMSSL